MKKFLQALPTILLLIFMASCHPAGCYGPTAFGYNTKGIAASNLLGIYTFDSSNASTLDRLGFTNHSGSIELKADMTFKFSGIPCITYPLKKGAYSSTTGKWRIVPNNAIWNVEFYDGAGFNSIGGYSIRSMPILGESPPYGIELTKNDEEGYYIRLHRVQQAK